MSAVWTPYPREALLQVAAIEELLDNFLDHGAQEAEFMAKCLRLPSECPMPAKRYRQGTRFVYTELFSREEPHWLGQFPRKRSENLPKPRIGILQAIFSVLPGTMSIVVIINVDDRNLTAQATVHFNFFRSFLNTGNRRRFPLSHGGAHESPLEFRVGLMRGMIEDLEVMNIYMWKSKHFEHLADCAGRKVPPVHKVARFIAGIEFNDTVAIVSIYDRRQ